MSPFQIVDHIYTKTRIKDEDLKGYPAFIINRILTEELGAVLFVNELNLYPELPGRWQFDYLSQNVPKRGKEPRDYLKEDRENELQKVALHLGMTLKKAREIMGILTEEQLKAIRKHD